MIATLAKANLGGFQKKLSSLNNMQVFEREQWEEIQGRQTIHKLILINNVYDVFFPYETAGYWLSHPFYTDYCLDGNITVFMSRNDSTKFTPVHYHTAC